MRTKVVKWGNSLGLRIPKSFAEDLGIEDGSPIELRLEAGRLVVSAPTESSDHLAQLLEKVTEKNLHGETDTGDAMGDEAW